MLSQKHREKNFALAVAVQLRHDFYHSTIIHMKYTGKAYSPILCQVHLIPGVSWPNVCFLFLTYGPITTSATMQAIFLSISTNSH